MFCENISDKLKKGYVLQMNLSISADFETVFMPLAQHVRDGQVARKGEYLVGVEKF